MNNLKKILFFSTVLVLMGGFAVAVNANHSWGGYHWARTTNPFALTLGDNVSSKWDSYLGTTSNDWSVSSVLNTVIKPGATKSSNCKAVSGRVEVCSSRYGNNGWLGIAQIWVSGSHITKGIVKVNDTYFDTSKYNTPAWRNLVMCQEVGHTLGLGHTDENFDNLPEGTCMDYSSDPTLNQHPNQHDYDMLESIYAHLDSTNTIASTGNDTGGRGKGRAQTPDLADEGVDLENPSSWGKVVSADAGGRSSLHEKNLGNGQKVFTFVTWVNEENHQD